MPELPDVEVTKRRVEAECLGRGIAGVEVGDEAVVSLTSRGELEARLPGEQFTAARRHGKFLFLELSGEGPRWLAFHFGMTGRLVPLPAEEAETLPEHARVVFRFEDGGALVFDCPRKFGYVEAVGSPEELIEDRELGPDALEVSAAELSELLAGWSGSAKSLLVDQSKLAGIGNVYADEILFQAAVHPRRPARELEGEERAAIHQALRRVLTTAIDHGAERQALPEGFLLPHRRPGASCPRCGGEIVRGQVSGRSAFWCGGCQ